jgi:hypothetical protein
MSKHDVTKLAWSILVRTAGDRQTLTYTELAEQLRGVSANIIARAVPQFLNPIQDYCDQHGLPRLNDLVVSKQRGWPSYDPGPEYDFATAREKVLAFDWTGIKVTMSDFAEAEARAKTRAAR